MAYLAGHTKRALFRDLAAGELTTAELAEKYEMNARQIEVLAGRHREEIYAIRADPTDEISHLWISKMVDRLAELEADVEFINSTFVEGVPPTADLLRVKHAALKHAAEVLGQLMPKLHGDGMLKQVTYEIVGVDTSKIWGPNPNPPNLDDDEGDDEQDA